MTAITLADAHAYQATCLARHMPSIPHQHFRLPELKARYPYLPNYRSTTSTRGIDFRGSTSFIEEVIASLMVKLWLDGVISRSSLGRIHIMFGPVFTTEAHLPFSGARTHSNNTAEMTAMVEALSFLGPPGLVARNEQACIFFDSQHAAGVCWVRSRLVHMCSWHSHGPCCSSNTGFDSPCNTCTDTDFYASIVTFFQKVVELT